jgi:hypothetical protein
MWWILKSEVFAPAARREPRRPTTTVARCDRKEVDVKQLGRSPISLSDLVRAGLLRPGQRLSFRSGTQTADVTSEGKLTFDGRDFHSPSTAARAAAGGTSLNGWLAWRVDVGGRQVTLATLRESYLAR